MKKGTLSVKSGLTFGEQISVSTASGSRDFILIKYLLALLGTFGILVTLISSFSLPVDTVVLFFKTAFYLGIFTLAAWKRTLAKFILPAFFLLMLIFFWHDAEEVIAGFKGIYNVVIDFAGKIYSDAPRKAAVGIENLIILKTCMGKAFGYLSAVVGFIMSLGIVYSQNLFPVLAVTLPALALELFIGLAPSAWAFVLVLCCWISVLAMQISSYKIKSKSSSDFVRERKRGNTYFPTHRYKNSVVSVVGIITAAVTIASYVGVQYYLTKNDLISEDKVEEIRVAAMNKIKDISVEQIVNQITPSPGQDVTLGNVDERKFRNVTDLQVSMPYTEHTVYLKGYVGGTYKDNGWTAVPKELYLKYNDMFKEFIDEDFVPQNMNYEFYSLASPFKNPGVIVVENTGADKRYLYAPYFADYSTESFIKYNKDTYVSSPWKNIYSFSYYHNHNQTEMMNLMYDGFKNSNGLMQNKINEFSVQEKKYREFVHEAYTVLPDDKFSIIKEEFGELKDSSDWVYKLYKVKKALQDCTYTLAPGKTPAGKDFVEYFLYENKQGYCTYFASAATIMLRAAGVPARYVEGYVVHPDDFPLKNGEIETIDIKDKSAHAWVEIYIDGAGWMPYEMTPSASLEEPEVTTPETTAPPVSVETTTSPAQTEPPVSEPAVSETVVTTNENAVTAPHITEPPIPAEENPVSYNWILWVGAGALILLILALRRVITLKNRRRAFHSPDTNKNIRNIYAYLEQLLNFIGLDNEKSLPYLEYADYVDKKLVESYKTDTSFKEVMKISLDAGFGENSLSTENEQLVYSFANELCEEIYKSLPALKKLWFKFGLNLK